MTHEVRCPQCGHPVAVSPDGRAPSRNAAPTLSAVADLLEPGFPPPGGSESDRDEAVPARTADPVSAPPPDVPPLMVDSRLWRGEEEADLLKTPDPDTALSGMVWTPPDADITGCPPDEVPTIELGKERIPHQVVEAAERWESSLRDDVPATPSAEHASPPPRTPGWLVLLCSYASAMTLACVWLLWQARQAPRPPRDASSETGLASAPDRNGRRGALSARVEPFPPLQGDHITDLGQPLRVGDLEITPRSVQVEPVRLERVNLTGKTQTRPGLPETLVLRLELTNRSPDAVFAPLDEAFVRQTDTGPPQGFVEGKDGARVYLYPLAEADEWGLVGQRFHTLRPGERVETLVASDEGALGRIGIEGPYLWRLRLRVGPDPDAIQDIGVRVTREQVR